MMKQSYPMFNKLSEENNEHCTEIAKCDYFTVLKNSKNYDGIELEDKDGFMLRGLINFDNKVTCIDLNYEKDYFRKQNSESSWLRMSQFDNIEIHNLNVVVLPGYKLFKLIKYKDHKTPSGKIMHQCFLLPCINSKIVGHEEKKINFLIKIR